MPSTPNSSPYSSPFAYPLLTDPSGLHLGLMFFDWVQRSAQQQDPYEEKRDQYLDLSSSADRLFEEDREQLRKEADGLLQKMASHTSDDFLTCSRKMVSEMKHNDLKNYVEQLKEQLKEHEEAALAEKEVAAQRLRIRRKETLLATLSIFTGKTPETPVEVEMMEDPVKQLGSGMTKTNG